MKIEVKGDKVVLNTQQMIALRIRAVLTSCAEIVKEHVQKAIRDGGNEATGDLYNSITFRVRKQFLNHIAEIYSKGLERPYQVYVSEGTRPHMPPVPAIKKWVEDKGIANEEDEVNKIAWAIARSISRKGTKAYKFFDIGMETAKPLVFAEIKKFNSSKGSK